MRKRLLYLLLTVSIASIAQTVSQERMQQIYEASRTPYKYGMVVAPQSNYNKYDCPTIFRQGNTWYIQGKTITSDNTWLTTYEDKIWIDENGIAHGSGIYVPAACWNFNDIDSPPSHYQLPRKEQLPVSSTLKKWKMVGTFART